MLGINFSSLNSMLCIMLAMSQQPGLTSASPVVTASLAARASEGAPKALPKNADKRYLAFQPSLDFKTDGCYNWPAIDKKGVLSAGLPAGEGSPSGQCRLASDLDNNNVYARRRCNRGWCAYMYAYYFPKDAAHVIGSIGHRHDWEHVIVWTKSDVGAGGVYENEQVKYVAASAHGGYDVRAVSDVRMDGTHPKIVYWQSLFNTHSFRFARPTDEKLQNHKKVWFRGDLVSWDGFPSGVRNKLLNANFGSAHLALKDEDFAGDLIETMNMKKLKNGPKKGEFDCAFDEQPATGGK
ncbi:uncharacterized protein CTRU02_204240 [Colletotrichum truncatum]|uniref:Uncharacterized protein n=1 Tax=Colletotrichum truncatum TaxID=5467 RepID=A0ACC3ZBH5_COLTU|nr:uncharacterized protein CTRU02_10092 [Colletotrichum truncatum]KAF6787797.1 hypothetical protein CTRU02_10092 [Colletotrichum truncatum]